MSKRFLIVDDDPLLTRSLAFRLQKVGYATFTVGNAEDALAMARDRQPDPILLDIGLPGMDGLQALRALEAQTAAPIIFVTAHGRELDEGLGSELGADDYITKPFDNDVRLAIAHGGALSVRSRPGEGSTFRLSLPVSEGDAGPADTLLPAPEKVIV